MRAKLKPVVKSVDQSILVKNDMLKSFYAPHHYHPEYEIIHIKKSHGIRVVGNNIDNYQAGEIILLGPGLPHFHIAGEVAEGDEWPIETIAVLFPESIIEANIHFPEFAQINRVLEQIKYGIELTEQTKMKVKEVLESMTMKPTLNNYFAIFKILEILAEENSTFKQLSSVQYDNKKLYNEKTRHVLDYITENYLSNIGVDEVAKQAGLSKSGFCNFFKSQTGMTYSHYLNMLRISKACELLAMTAKSISEIAFEIGYENLAYFNRRFKEIKGVTPKEFRGEIQVKHQ